MYWGGFVLVLGIMGLFNGKWGMKPTKCHCYTLKLYIQDIQVDSWFTYDPTEIESIMKTQSDNLKELGFYPEFEFRLSVKETIAMK